MIGWCWVGAGARGILAGGRVACAVRVCGLRLLVRPHRVPVDHATCEVSVRGLHARVDYVHAYTCPSQIAVVIPPVDRAACAGRASDEGKKPRE